MNKKLKIINQLSYYIIIIWTFLLLGIAIVFSLQNYKYADDLAKNEAVVSVKKDLAYRSWVASHGGVYVPIDKKTPPNPHLSHILNRDVVTGDGEKLTLMNPAYTLSQMMQDYSKLYGVKTHITSLILLNQKNRPDKWERSALQKIEYTQKPYFEKTKIDDKEYFRYINPLYIQPSCLKCHAFQGYRVGDIRGGVSISVPLQGYYASAKHHTIINLIAIFLIYLLGLVAIISIKKLALKTLKKKIHDYEQNIYTLVTLIEQRDTYTAGHSKRVAQYGTKIAEEMGYTNEEIEEFTKACMLHDIGKISTPDSVLLKPSKLSKLEYEIIQQHVVSSYEILKDIDIYKDIANIVRYHHEHYDGNGYPEGLKGDEIPLLSQIMALADSFDAMTTNRIYKPRMSVQQALREIEELSAKQFHPKVVMAALKALKNIEVDLEITQRPKSELEKERFAYFYNDPLVGCYNLDYLQYVLSYNTEDEFQMHYACFFELHNFSNYNQKFGWNSGSEILKEIANQLKKANPNNLVFRVYGDDFIILVKERKDMMEYQEIDSLIQNTPITYSHHFIKLDNINSLESLENILVK